MSDTESQDAQIVPAVEADRAVPAVQQTPPYSLVPLSTQVDPVALARFTEGLPTVKLTDEERRIDGRPLEEIESDANEERRTLLREALPQYDAHLRRLRARIKAGELLPNEPVPRYGELYVGWMGATKQQAKELDQQLLDLEARTEDKRDVVEHRFQRVMQERLREKADAIVPSDLATVREALFQYEQTKDPIEATLNALRNQYAKMLNERCHELIQGMRFPLVCRFDGVPFHVIVYTGSWDEQENHLFCKSACETAFNEAILRDHPEWRKVQKEYVEAVQNQYDKEMDKAEIYGTQNEVKKGDWDADWLYDCIQDIGGQRVISVVKGNLWGRQCWSCSKYFQTPSTMPEDFPAKKCQVCSWNCLVFRAYPPYSYYESFAEAIDPDLSAGSEWWETIEHTTFPPTSWAQVERRAQKQAHREAREQARAPRRVNAEVIDMDVVSSSAEPHGLRGRDGVLALPRSKPTMTERILAVLEGLGAGEKIEDRALRKSAGVTAAEVKAYVSERDRLTDSKEIGRSGTGYRGSPFKFWAQ
jgi:hypothetical protein